MAISTDAQYKQRVLAGKARGRQLTSEHQRQARQALSNKVSPQYFKFIGRRGGRRYMRNFLRKVSETWDFPPSVPCRVSEARRLELVEDMRQHYREQAEAYHDEGVGCRLMMIVFSPEYDTPRRKRKKSKR